MFLGHIISQETPLSSGSYNLSSPSSRVWQGGHVEGLGEGKGGGEKHCNLIKISKKARWIIIRNDPLLFHNIILGALIDATNKKEIGGKIIEK